MINKLNTDKYKEIESLLNKQNEGKRKKKKEKTKTTTPEQEKKEGLTGFDRVYLLLILRYSDLLYAFYVHI